MAVLALVICGDGAVGTGELAPEGQHQRGDGAVLAHPVGGQGLRTQRGLAAGWFEQPITEYGVGQFVEIGDQPLDARVEESVARSVCKQAAIKAGQVMAREEMEELIRGLEGCASPRTCPHGRPTMIHLSVEQLAREFGRG